MLETQDFPPTPIIGVGPELFYDHEGVQYLDLEFIGSLRKRVLNQISFFKFAYFGLSVYRGLDQKLFLAKIREFGIPFVFTYVVDLTLPEEVEKARRSTWMLELICSPEFSAKVPSIVPTVQGTLKLKAAFIECLISYLDVAVPYQKGDFINHLKTLL